MHGGRGQDVEGVETQQRLRHARATRDRGHHVPSQRTGVRQVQRLRFLSTVHGVLPAAHQGGPETEPLLYRKERERRQQAGPATAAADPATGSTRTSTIGVGGTTSSA